jgi:uncharacterized protein YkwD
VLPRRLLAGIAGVAALLALWLPAAGATTGAAPAAAERHGTGAGASSSQATAAAKSRRRCRAKRARHRGSERVAAGSRRVARTRRCRRAKRKPERLRALVPVAPTLPSEPPPAFGPPIPLPQPPQPLPFPGTCSGADTVPNTSNLATIRSATLCLINAQRAGYSLAPLVDNSLLFSAAQGHADDMAAQGYFSHDSADGRTWDQRIRNTGYAGRGIAENIAWGGRQLGTPRNIVNAWMNSSGHRANILNGSLIDSGIGVAARTPQGGSGGTYVHDFGAP